MFDPQRNDPHFEKLAASEALNYSDSRRPLEDRQR